jgi:hypothetical protein
MKDTIAEAIQKRKHEPGHDMLLYGERERQSLLNCLATSQKGRKRASNHPLERNSDQ